MFKAIPFLLFLYLLFFLTHYEIYPVFWPDEVLFYSPTLSLVKDKTLATPVLSGLIEGMERVTLWMPPTYFLYAGFFQKLFGTSIFISRLASLSASILSVFPLLGIFHSLEFNRKNSSLLIALIFTDLLFYKISATARMESLGLFFSLSALYLLISKTHPIWYAVVGILQGLAVLSHPFTIGFIFIHFLYYILYRKFSLSEILLGLLGFISPIFLWFFFYITPNLGIFLLQFGAQLGRKKDLLFSVFTIITKIKIILSGFKFSLFKGLVMIAIFIGFFFVWKERIDIQKKKRLIFIFGSLSILFALIFISSESWYVYYIVPFLSFVLVDFFESKFNFFKALAPAWLISNLLGIVVTVTAIWMPTPVKKIQDDFFHQLYVLTEGKNKVYLQSIPDPYFYFIEKNPDLILKEFIPGELPLPADFSKKEMESQDVYIFYNEELIHPTIKNHLDSNRNDYEKFEIHLESPKFFEYKFNAYVYRKI